MSWKDVHKSGKYFSRIRWHQPEQCIGTIKPKNEDEINLILILKDDARKKRIHIRELIFKILREKYLKP